MPRHSRKECYKSRLCFEVEVEPANTQMLLGCLLLSVQDAAALEEAEHRHSDG